MISIEEKSNIPNERLSDFYDRWVTLNNSDLPHPKNVNDEFIGDLGGYLKFSSLEKDPFRLRYDQIGYALKKLYDENMEGKYIDELFDPWIRKSVTETYQMAAETKRPVYEKKGFSTFVGSIGYEYLILPFSDNNKDVTAFITCLFPLGMKMEHYEDWHKVVGLTPWLKG